MTSKNKTETEYNEEDDSGNADVMTTDVTAE